MTCMKKLTALLVSAALALSLLAGCGGSKALSQVIADLLSGMYNNVTVEVDPDLTAALKKAAAAGSTQEEVLAALVEELNLSGVRLTLRQLQEGRQGDRGVELVFQPGTDPDAAARSAVNGWASAFGALPDDGSYTARVAMIEAEGGYYIAVDVEVLKAGTPDKDEPDEPDKPTDTVVSGEGFSYNVTQNKVEITGTDGLKNLFDTSNDTSNTDAALAAARDSGFDGITITLKPLENNQTYTVSQQLASTFKGTLKSADENTKASVTLSGSAGLFGTLEDGQVENLKVTVENTISTGTTDNAGSTCVGAVANINQGQITGCEVTIGSNGISSSSNQRGSAFAGGIVGENGGSISNCKVTVNGSITATKSDGGSDAEAGGIAGYNNGSISGCTVALSSSGSISATGTDSTGIAGIAGGIAGFNEYNCTINDCTVTLSGSSSISATATGTATASAGGIAGQSNGTVSCGPASGPDGSDAHATATGPSNGTYTATVSAGAGATTATCPYNFTPSGGNVPNAAAGTTCGLIKGAPK